MWVHPEFKDVVSLNSAIKKVDMITLTRELADKEKIKKNKDRGFKFGF